MTSSILSGIRCTGSLLPKALGFSSCGGSPLIILSRGMAGNIPVNPKLRPKYVIQPLKPIPGLMVPSDNYPGKPPGPLRDMENFPPLRLRKYAPKTRLLVIPESWFVFFHQKTGYSGPYVFMIGLATFLASKEIYVIEHGTMQFLAWLILISMTVKKFGKKIDAYLQNIHDYQMSVYDNIQSSHIKSLQEQIEAEKHSQWQAAAQTTLVEAKRENVALQLETTFRSRQMSVYTAIKRRLDYQVELLNAEARIRHHHMVNWIIGQVQKALTPELEQAVLRQCIVDLKSISARA